ncbi:MAG TPA: hypothetical protein DCQ50_21120 [Chryseobacterium sp.]|nr:hypothetical protein [Chryseobacterium sp.]
MRGLTLKHKKITYFLIAISLCGALFNVGYFGSPTMSAYFFYIIPSAITIVFAGLILATRGIDIPKFNYTPAVLLCGLTLYYYLQSFFTPDGKFLAVHVYMLVNCLLLLALILLFKIQKIEIAIIYKIVFFLAVIESLICLMQFIGIVKSNNEYMTVSGTWINPNVTAIYLSLSLPAVISIFINPKSDTKKIYSVGVLFIIAAILSLKCRTAFIGSLISTLILLGVHYNCIVFIKTKVSLTKKISFGIVILLLTMLGGNYLYKAKQASADGRQLIWKISASMISQKPIVGLGYGMFEREYNIKQAHYFASKGASENEIANASFVYMAYNEFLQNFVEGGMMGFVLFTTFLMSLLVRMNRYVNEDKPGQNRNVYTVAAHAAIAGFAVMSLINFTVQAIPAMAIFIIYAAVVCSFDKSYQKKIFAFEWLKTSLCSIFLLGALFILFSQIPLASAYAKTNNAISQSNENDNTNRVEALKSLQGKIQTSDFYYTALGKVLYKEKLYAEALKMFKQSAQFSSSPSIQMQICNCYCKLKQFDSAIYTLKFISNMAPNRLTPKYGMMKIYQQISDSSNAQKMAHELVTMQPKGPSPKAIFYKQEAQNYLNEQ